MTLFLLPFLFFALDPDPAVNPIDVARADAIRELAPHVSPAAALEHAIEARAHATADISAELLLATAYRESKFRPRVVSRWVYAGGRRRAVTGVWTEPAIGETVTYRYCGYLQTKPFEDSLASCLDLGDDIHGSYELGAAALDRWVSYCRTKGWPRGRARLGCAIAGYRGGWRAADRGGGPAVWLRLELADRIRARSARS